MRHQESESNKHPELESKNWAFYVESMEQERKKRTFIFILFSDPRLQEDLMALLGSSNSLLSSHLDGTISYA